MLQTVSKTFFHVLAGSLLAEIARIALRHARAAGFARRFIAGETVEEAIDAARQIQATGLHVTLDYLGESVASIAEADAGDARLHRPHRRASPPRASSATSR